MSEMRQMVIEVVEKMLKDHVTKEHVDALAAGKWDQQLWQLFEENGMLALATADMAESDMTDLFALYPLMGKYAAPIPFVEHTLANVLLKTIGAETYDTLTTFVLVDEWHDTLPLVPWARDASQVVVIGREKLAVFALYKATIQKSTNLASEPRDTVTFSTLEAHIEVQLTTAQYDQLRTYITMATVLKSAGAIEAAVALTVQFSKEREQFGRPIHRFQMVQRHLADIAGERAIMQAAAGNLLENIVPHEVGYARIRLEQAIRIVTASAHQVHAAIGVTDEHPLNHYTRRLWAWRDELVKASEWQHILAQQVLEQDVDIWTALTAQPNYNR